MSWNKEGIDNEGVRMKAQVSLCGLVWVILIILNINLEKGLQTISLSPILLPTLG